MEDETTLLKLQERITELDQLEMERRRAEEKLRIVKEKIHKVFDKADDVVTIIQDRQIKFVNSQAERLIGYTPGELIGTSFAHYIQPDELPRLAKFYLQRIAGENVPNTYETIIRHKDGGNIRIEILASVVQYLGRLADLVIVRKVEEKL